MTAQIRPNRMQVSDRFPMLGFAVKADRPDIHAEVVLATEIDLFKSENRSRRTAANFYTSREHGLLSVPRGDGVFVVPPEVLARFIGQDRLFFGLATGAAGQTRLEVDAIPREGSPYVSLSGFTGRTLRRSFGAPQASTQPVLEWSGDAPHPGSEPARRGASVGGPGQQAAPPTAPVDYDDGFGELPDIPAREAAAGRQMGESEDLARARRYVPRWRDLLTYSVPSGVSAAIARRNMSIQTIDYGGGDLNLDRYSVNCTRLPPGKSAADVVEYLRRNITSFLSSNNTEFVPYESQDATKISSDDPVGGVWKLNIIGPDNAAVVICKNTDQYFRVATVEAPETGSHPVSGLREWGYSQQGDTIEFYTRAADTATTWGTGWAAWMGANHLWESFQRKLTEWINANGGSATVGGIISERFDLDIVRRIVPLPTSGAQGHALARNREQNGNRENRSGDPRERADRIGGQFAGRIGEALDRGLAHKTLEPLLATLEGPASSDQTDRSRDHAAMSRAQEAGWSINWDGLTLKAQPTPRACWATALAMIVQWRDNEPQTPQSIADRCGRDIAQVLPWADRHDVADQLGLFAHPPQNYTAEGFRDLIEDHGPLYVGKSMGSAEGNTHAVAVVGMVERDGTRYVRIHDPAHGGRRYTTEYNQFAREYELAIRGDDNETYVQILSSKKEDLHGRSVNRSNSAPAGFNMAADNCGTDDVTAVEQGAGGKAWSINWDGVDLIPQPTGKSCWATTLAMLLNWRGTENQSLTPHAVADRCGKSIEEGLPWAERQAAADALGLDTHPPQSYLPEGFRDLLENNGPLYVGKRSTSNPGSSGHAVLVVGMYEKGAKHFVRIFDPWDRPVGSPGNPDNYDSTHDTGSRYIMKYDTFMREYEMAASGSGGNTNVQILSGGVPQGKSINRSNTPPSGFQMAAPDLPAPPAPQARGQNAVAAAEVIGSIGGNLVSLHPFTEGDISLKLVNWNGKKHPQDRAPEKDAPFIDGEIDLDRWPMQNFAGIDDIYQWLKVTWQFNGTSIANVNLHKFETEDALSWGLTVDSRLLDDARLYPRSSQALAPGPELVPAVHLDLTYTFDETLYADQIAHIRVSLFADGTHEIKSEWRQKTVDAPGAPINRVRPMVDA